MSGKHEAPKPPVNWPAVSAVAAVATVVVEVAGHVFATDHPSATPPQEGNTNDD